MNFAYLLRCRDGSMYAGWTNDLEARVKAHNAGEGAKYTRSRRPVELVYYEEFETREEAMSREWHLKRLSRREKLALISQNRNQKEENHVIIDVDTHPAGRDPE